MKSSRQLWRAALAIALVALLAFSPGGSSAQAPEPEERYALVVGISDYGGAANLPNATNDARLVSGVLAQAGFTLIDVPENPSEGQLREAAGRLFDRLSNAGTNTTVVFYYVGHAVQTGGENRLIPARTDLFSGTPTNADFEDQTVSAQWLLRRLREANIARVLMVLDACRTTRLNRARIGPDEGLSSMPVTAGGPRTMVMFSSEPGQPAFDGSGQNSAFAIAFAGGVATEGKNLNRMDEDIREHVMAATGGRQRPVAEGGFDYQFTPERAAVQIGRSTLVSSDRLQSADDGRVLLDEALASGRTLTDIEREAAAGDGSAYYLLGMAYWDGVGGVASDHRRAMSMMRRAAVRGVPRAANSLGVFYCCSDNIPKDEAEALEWFLIGAELGSPSAMRNVGLMYRDGTGVEVDFAVAERYFRMATDAGNTAAWQNWIYIYSWSQSPLYNLARAQQMREEAFRRGFADIAVDISDAYRYGTTGSTTEPDPQRAFDILLEGGREGCGECFSRAAGMLAGDELGEPRLDDAFEMYMNGVELNDVASMVGAARAYAGGKGVEEDDAAAYQLFLRAEAAGDIESIGSVGMALARGEGVARNPVAAAERLRRVLARDLSTDLDVRHAVYAPYYWSYASALAVLLEQGDIQPTTPDEAAQLRARYGHSEVEGSMKRFTVPVRCGDIPSPFHVYIINWERPDDETPVDSQAEWALHSRGCVVPEDVLTAFRSLRRIARENNVSFVDLSVYALGAAQQEQTTASEAQETSSQ